MARVETPRFCAQCGGPLHSAPADDPYGARYICTACGRRVYLDPKTAVATVVNHKGRIVLLKRAQNDSAHGKWILPGGHVDQGEVVTHAAMREAKEETGLSVELRGLLGVYSYRGNPVVLLVYHAEAQGGSLCPSQEALEIKEYEPQDLPWDRLGYRSTGDALRDYLDMAGLAPYGLG